MKFIYRRSMSLVLAILLLLSIPLQAFAESLTWGEPGQVTVWAPGKGGNGKNLNPTYPNYGFRITFTDSHQIDESLTTLTGAYTKDDLKAQKAAVGTVLGHTYIEPGNGGIYVDMHYHGTVPANGISSSTPTNGFEIGSHIIMANRGATVTEADNELAWYCYPGIEGGTRLNSIQCNQDMYTALMQATNNYGTGGDYLYDLRQKFMAQKGFTSDSQLRSYLYNLIARIISDTTTIPDNLKKFTWDTENNINAGVEVTASDLAMWSRIGYLTTLIQFAWYAQLSGNSVTYNEAETLIWDYVQGGYTSNVMPLLEVEMVQMVGIGGTTAGVSSETQFITLPYTLAASYDMDIVQNLFAGGWTGDMRKAIAEWVGTRAINKGSEGWVSQGFGGKFKDGGFTAATSGSYYNRHYLDLLRASEARYNSFGYTVVFTYDADVPDWGSGAANNAQSAPVPGSFTWKLTPSGVNDMTALRAYGSRLGSYTQFAGSLASFLCVSKFMYC